MKNSIVVFLICLALSSCSEKPQSASSVLTDQETAPKTKVEEHDNQEMVKGIIDPFFDLGNEEMIKMSFGEKVLKYQMDTQNAEVSYPAIMVFPETDRELIFGFASDDSTLDKYEHLEYISTKAERWLTEDGIFVGMTLAQLEELNGAPFSFFGLEHDMAGYCWFENGKLKEKSPRLGIRLEPASNQTHQETFQTLYTDDILKSDNPAAQKAG